MHIAPRNPQVERRGFETGQRFNQSEFAEYMKLEEAHLPAPFGGRIALGMSLPTEQYAREMQIELMDEFISHPEDQEESASAYELQELEYVEELPTNKITNNFNAFELQAYSSHAH